MSDSRREAAAAQLQRMITGNWLAQSIYAAAKLRIPDRLKGGPKSAAELAAETGTQAEALYRLLRMLTSFGVFERQANDRFALSAMSELLLSDAPDSKWAMTIMMGEEHYRAWAEVLYSLRTGKPAFEQVYGEGIFDFLSKHPEQAAIFDAAMTAVHGRETDAMIEAYDFSSIKTLVDIGGGNGTLLEAVLRRYASMRGILFDLPHVVERARARLAGAGIGERLETAAGNFFESVVPGGDAYLMRHIIHDWDDERCRRILRNCRAAMNREGRVLLIETIIQDDDEPSFGKMLDLNMLVLPGGKERTEHEYRELLAAAGLRLTRIVPTRGEISVIEARAE